MPARISVSRLHIRGVTARDHPAPGDLEVRLKDAAGGRLPDALGKAIDAWPGERIMRLRRLDVDITLDAAFAPEAFAALLSKAIVTALRRIEASGASSADAGVMCFASRSLYLAALVQALAEGRAAECWWLREAEGLRFLPRGAAIRTALLADATAGLEALLCMAAARLAQIMRALGEAEASRVLHGLAAIGSGDANVAECAAAIAAAAGELPQGALPLELFVRAAARRPATAGPVLGDAARLWAGKGGASHETKRVSWPAGALAEAVVREIEESRAGHDPACVFTRFGGLFLLLRDLGVADIARTVADRPGGRYETACLIGYAALGLCAGRVRYAQWLADPLWRELFGLDVKAPVAALVAELGAISPDAWEAMAPLGAPIRRQRDARFLLAPRNLAGSPAASRMVAALALAALSRFARRLAGFRDASAPFLWANLLSTGATLERRAGGWTARLGRPPLDVLLSLSKLADGTIGTPSGARVDLARVAP